MNIPPQLLWTLIVVLNVAALWLFIQAARQQAGYRPQFPRLLKMLPWGLLLAGLLMLHPGACFVISALAMICPHWFNGPETSTRSSKEA